MAWLPPPAVLGVWVARLDVVLISSRPPLWGRLWLFPTAIGALTWSALSAWSRLALPTEGGSVVTTFEVSVKFIKRKNSEDQGPVAQPG
ncbi:hypothetical protein Pisl_1558 [Pyrobaculum islandicum DSM 4184]|uniref:Uncharacterized protein n=1 Tax=Pyrobaculum islandicum (strain DSM 4184 / JCM 9189 / GEO3) TaxID=384616 RepID=A1RUT0_PYRIL|nr:hypothetical protein Pisl_1558 [Pyrobaculum islandicum DSM 4184]